MSHTVGVEDVGVLGRPWPGLNGRAIQELSTAQGGPAGKYEKAGGVWDPNVCVPKMARPDSPCFKFPSSHNGHFGLGGGGGGGAPPPPMGYGGHDIRSPFGQNGQNSCALRVGNSGT